MLSSPVTQKRLKLLLGALMLNLLCFTPLQAGQNLERILLQVSGVERAALQHDKVAITGDRGEYRASFLVEASASQVWEVLTDYDDFTEFLPNVTNAQLLESQGNRKVFEQVQSVSVLFFTREVRVKIATNETEFTQISFNLVEGDLNRLEGSWELIPIITNGSSTPTQVLVTYTVTVEPDADTPANFFYGLYKDNLKASLEAVKTEIENRVNYQ